MTDTEYLRQAMRAETTGLPMHVPMDRIHRRARGLRATRAAVVAAGVALVVSAAAVPGFALLDNAGPAGGAHLGGGITTSPDPCHPELGGEGNYPLLGSAIETGTSIGGPDNRRYDVVIALVGERDDPVFTVAFRDSRRGYPEPWNTTELPLGPNGDFAAKGRTWHFESSHLPLDGGRVLDVGVYSRAAHRITAAAGGRVWEAHIARNAETGLTLFWVEHAAALLPATSDGGPPDDERYTITAYDADGQVQHTMTPDSLGRPQNPRDDSPDPSASPTPGIPCS